MDLENTTWLDGNQWLRNLMMEQQEYRSLLKLKTVHLETGTLAHMSMVQVVLSKHSSLTAAGTQYRHRTVPGPNLCPPEDRRLVYGSRPESVCSDTPGRE